MSDTDIAVVGVGCRFPDAWTPMEFWRNIDAGAVAMRELTDEQLAAAGVPPETLAAPDFVRVASTLPGAADFAADFFGYPAQEAETVDPQQRIFLETCWEALESAGHPAGEDGPTIGVFAGGAESTYRAAMLVARAAEGGLVAAVDDLDLHLGGLGDFLTSRVAYKFGLRGPSVGVQTACSSSLYAVHYATLSLLSGECDIALAGGATVLEPLAGYRYRPGGLQSVDGYCRSFDAGSTGTSFGSGVGVVALRRLSDALTDGDPVLAVLKGSAVGNDGAARQGFSAPSPAGVADVVAAALRVAGVSGDQLRYVEAHGSATALGDHIELLGLTQALRESTTRSGFCGLGSVKTNIGHGGPAAGIAGFIKAVNIVRTGELPPHPQFQRPRDPGILAESPFVIDKAGRVCADDDRHVLINSMGMGGTNVAAVLAPPPAPTREPAPAPETVRLVISARTRSELDTLCQRLADELDRGTVPVADVAHTLRVGRRSFADRRVIAAPANRLAGALRLPRAPLARTVRATPRRAVVVLPPDGDPPALLTALLAALPAGTEVLSGPQESMAANVFPILIGRGEPGPDRHVLPADGPDPSELIDEAVTAAWLHGVDVTWDSPVGRRVALPTYPFTRRRYWALDRLTPVQAPGTAAPVPTEAGSLEEELAELWRSLFGVESVGLDDEFGELGGTSLLSVRMALEIQQRHGVLVNVHRAGGTRSTVRRLAEIVRGKLSGAARGSADIDPVADGDGNLVDADLQLSLGPLAPAEAPGTDVLLTGATGFLGAFVLHELLNATTGRIYCLVRARTEAAGRERLRTVAEKFLLPEPDPDRVHLVLGDLRDIGRVCSAYRDGELSTRVGSVIHVAAKVVFTEPYRVLRDDNVLPAVELLKWMRGNGIRDFSFVSTVAATAPAMGMGGKVPETREQPLDPQQGGYGVSKWVCERLLERAELDGMRIRVFRPGFVLASSRTGACNDKDLIWHIMASGLAIGAHPLDDRGNPMAGVDLVARAIAELSGAPGSVGRVYHLVARRSPGLRSVFRLLADAGLATEAVAPDKWLALVSERALASGDEVLSNMALYELEGHELGEHDMEANAWVPWLRRNGLDPAPTGDLLRAGLTYLADRRSPVGELLSELIGVRA